jgi:hypothetical protein
MDDHGRSHADEEHENEFAALRAETEHLQTLAAKYLGEADDARAEIQVLNDQLQSYKSKVNRAYLLAEMLDEEALKGAWTDVKEAKMRAAALIRQHMEG